jgi:hypothetical protein
MRSRNARKMRPIQKRGWPVIRSAIATRRHGVVQRDINPQPSARFLTWSNVAFFTGAASRLLIFV